MLERKFVGKLTLAFVNLIWPLLILSFGPTWPLVAPAGADASV
jgi:hypothetical protein